MWKKYKTALTKWYRQRFASDVRQQQVEDLDIKNHRLMIRDTQYFLGRAQFPDIPEIVAVERAVYDGKTPWDAQSFANELKRKQDRLYLVIRKNDQLIAFAGCSFDLMRKEAHITNIAVLPDWQGDGLGEFLMRALVRKARHMGMNKVTLEVRMSNARAQKLYQKLGFRQTGIKRGYYFGDHEDAMDMAMPLLSADEVNK
ncbi:ribosomal protein S18-alanine N-acetyltransferase [Furfurilactobacillus siliginis]|uniref:Acetyltransferase n=1 Tax=Furfurilactobacillus siliginis TaxID=348151 RepID=A0A0R2L4U2_9LACO|nr:ribosomal protein S18-alanine N-acetyltransferase [Furfurilactobacillus siliginis]KRN96578.1 acetyltransferase [Furfurilactobacillus siliginis]GEK29494.1 ribosomal-protein-alanine acetyltransferase [Furfurilactobacillus siliginis]